jgi:hypothetical protein
MTGRGCEAKGVYRPWRRRCCLPRISECAADGDGLSLPWVTAIRFAVHLFWRGAAERCHLGRLIVDRVSRTRPTNDQTSARERVRDQQTHSSWEFDFGRNEPRFVSSTWRLGKRARDQTNLAKSPHIMTKRWSLGRSRDHLVGARVGSSIWNFEPLPNVDSTQMRPPCISTICLAMARPRPVPPLAFALELST